MVAAKAREDRHLPDLIAVNIFYFLLSLPSFKINKHNSFKMDSGFRVPVPLLLHDTHMTLSFSSSRSFSNSCLSSLGDPWKSEIMDTTYL